MIPPLSNDIKDDSATNESSISYRVPLLQVVDRLRLEVGGQMDRHRQAEMAQYFTPMPIASAMARMMQLDCPEIKLLDAGAGIGCLFSACIAVLCCKASLPKSVHVTAYEAEPIFCDTLKAVAERCRQECERVGVEFSITIRPVDFIEEAVSLISNDIFSFSTPGFNAAILNPPYRKIAPVHRQLLSKVGIEVPNLYAGFLALAINLLATQGEMVTITPRSFCNGVYFRPFRKLLLDKMALDRIHLFESRNEVFEDSSILQETIIIHSIKGITKPEHVSISLSRAIQEGISASVPVAYSRIIAPDDPEQFIRIATNSTHAHLLDRMSCLPAALHELDLTVSTGRVVDFRATSYLKEQPETSTAPLLYPTNLELGVVRWPQQTKKPQALVVCAETEALLVPNETFVLVKRFSSKEERRRIVAAVCEKGRLPGNYLGFENHLSYFHRNGHGFDLPLARGLSLFLNSTLLDTYFRQFSGHTQVNATDLRNIRYPSQQQLRAMSNLIDATLPAQAEIDTIVEKALS